MSRAEAKDIKALFPRRAVSHNGYYVNSILLIAYAILEYKINKIKIGVIK